MEMIDGPEEEDDAEGQGESATADQIDSVKERNTHIDGNLILLPVSVEKGDTTL